MSTPSPFRIAVIGGGISGVLVSHEMANLACSSTARAVHVTLFDQGRNGVGGRASHRNVDCSFEGLPPELHNTLKFDHGCQFFRADSGALRALVKQWEEKGYCQQWDGNFGQLGDSAEFFG